MKRPYQITSVVLILFCAFIMRESLELRYYTSLGPGPGFFPFWISLLVAVLAGVMFYQATFKDAEPMPADFFPSKTGWLRMGAICFALAASVVLMEPLGYRLTMLSFLLFLLFALGRVNIIVTALVALGGSWGAYYVFVEWLKVVLPVGIFGI